MPHIFYLSCKEKIKKALTETRIDKMVSEVCNFFKIQNSDSYFLIIFLSQRKSIGPLTTLFHIKILTDELETFFCFTATEEDICIICHNSTWLHQDRMWFLEFWSWPLLQVGVTNDD
jgi:hypothetical protein